MKHIILSILVVASCVFAEQQTTKVSPERSIANSQETIAEEVKTQTTLEITNTFNLQQITAELVERTNLERERVKWQKCALVSTRYPAASLIVKKYCGFLDEESIKLNKEGKLNVKDTSKTNNNIRMSPYSKL